MADSSKRKRTRKTPNGAPTATKALAEAIAIVKDARDADIDPDWSKNPANPTEAALRAAIIRRVVIEENASRESFDRRARELGGQEPDEERRAMNDRSTAGTIRWQLQNLHPDGAFLFQDDGDEIGDDLRGALEHWERAYDEADKRVGQVHRRRLVTEARLDIKSA